MKNNNNNKIYFGKIYMKKSECYLYMYIISNFGAHQWKPAKWWNKIHSTSDSAVFHPDAKKHI